MRTTLLPNLLALVAPNRPYAERFRLFELGNVSLPTAEGREQRTLLAGVSFTADRGQDLEEHVRAVKGALEDRAAARGAGPLAVATQAADASPWQIGGHWLEVGRGGQPVGALGVLAGAAAAEVAPVGQVVWFELDMGVLGGTPQPEATFVAPPVYPGSWHDFSLVWPTGRGFGELAATLDGFAHPLLRRREFLYRYAGKGLEPGMGSYTFRFLVGSSERTLTGEEIEAFRAELLAFLQGKGIALR
jgi:phenylalanyl-tRNA synthetase beta chain